MKTFTVTTQKAFVLMMQELGLIALQDEAELLWSDIVNWFDQQPEITRDILLANDPELQIKFGNSYILVRRYNNMYDFDIPKSINCGALMVHIEQATLASDLPFIVPE